MEEIEFEDSPFVHAKIWQLEAALISYVERYGLSESAREALSQVQAIQGSSTPDRQTSQPNDMRVLQSEVVPIFRKSP